MNKFARFMLCTWVFVVSILLNLLITQLRPEFADKYRYLLLLFLVLSGFTVSSIAMSE